MLLLKIVFADIGEYLTACGKCYHCVKHGFSSWTYQVLHLFLAWFLCYHITQEAVAATTAIQEEIFLEMGVGKPVL